MAISVFSVILMKRSAQHYVQKIVMQHMIFFQMHNRMQIPESNAEISSGSSCLLSWLSVTRNT